MQKPRTLHELCDVVGGVKHSMHSVSSWLRALEDEGLVVRTHVKRQGIGGRTPFLFTWVGLDDAAKPLP